MNCFSHKFFTALCFDQDFELADACVLPDEDENQNGYSCHFYNPVTGKCYLGTEDSAKNRFLWHLCNYLMTKKKEELNKKNFNGTSELVDVVITGDMKVVSVDIKNKESITVDDLEVIQDMTVIAINDAIGKVKAENENILGAYGSQFGGLF